jgi:hypothetical protein
MSTPVVISDRGDGVAERANAILKTRFITGASKGLGRQWTISALERGDRVAVAARNVDLLGELASEYGRAVLPIALDVRDREAAFAAVAQAREHFGRLDVVVNNAGYAHFGNVEEFERAPPCRDGCCDGEPIWRSRSDARRDPAGRGFGESSAPITAGRGDAQHACQRVRIATRCLA